MSLSIRAGRGGCLIEFPRNLVLGSPRRCLPLYGVLSYFKSSTKAVVDCTKSMEVGMVSTHPPFQGIVRAVSLAALLGESSQSLFFLRSIPPPTPLRESCPCPTLLQEPTAIYASGHSCHVRRYSRKPHQPTWSPDVPILVFSRDEVRPSYDRKDGILRYQPHNI